MSADGIQNLPDSPEQVEDCYRDRVTMPPVGAQTLRRRAEHFASGARFGLREPGAMQRLHNATKDLRSVPRLSSLLPKVLEGALSLTGADFGNIQILDPATGSLKIVTHAGFSPEFLGYFAVVDDDHAACGRAARQGAQIVIADVHTDPGFAPHREIAAAAGFRAVQSTPLADYAGRLLGVVSTHFRRPHRPSERDLRIMELYGDFAGEAVTRHLGTSSQHPSDPISRALISALLDPARARQANVSVPFELWVMGQMTASFARRTAGLTSDKDVRSSPTLMDSRHRSSDPTARQSPAG
jgi:hypothetical protein